MRLRYFVRQFLKTVNPTVNVDTGTYFLLAAAMLVVPVKWFFAWLLAVLIHEICHYIALRLLLIDIKKITIGCHGIIMETDSLGLMKELICAYAGPLGGLLLLLFARLLPRTAVCALLLSAYNLLPVYPLDGGRGIACLIRAILPQNLWSKAMSATENVTLFIIMLACLLLATRYALGLFPIFIGGILLWRCKASKLSCKKSVLGLQ